MKKGDLERQLQQWLALYLHMHRLLYCASAYGFYTSKVQAGKIKKAGYRAGFPDMFIYEPRGKYHGMAIELKMGSRTTLEQKGWRSALCERGYYAVIMPTNLTYRQAQDWLEKEIEDYLKGEQHDPSS